MVVSLHPLASAFLTALGAQPGSSELEIGGGVALWHYLPYRGTNGVDLWWVRPTAEAREAIESAISAVAAEHGLDLTHRAQTGEESWDLKREGKQVFAVQIARKDQRVEPPVKSRWGAVWVESLAENVANKMAALVTRGAPRDLLDMATLLRAGLVTAPDCWRLWSTREQPISAEKARSAVLGYVASLDLRRSLPNIQVPAQRQSATEARQTIRELCQVD